MDVRAACDGDRLRVVALLRDSHVAAGFTFPFRAAVAESLFKQHAEAADACCLVLGSPAVGLLMARCFEHPFGAGKWANETVWFIDPSARGRSALAMLAAYEVWAQAAGCNAIGMATMASHDVSALYRRRGFAAAETHFIKAI